jgi:Predicted site-specific integrase-resolvase
VKLIYFVCKFNYNALKPKEVCQKLGISYRTLQSYVKKGYIKPVILQSGKWRFKEEDVERLMGVVRKRNSIIR